MGHVKYTPLPDRKNSMASFLESLYSLSVSIASILNGNGGLTLRFLAVSVQMLCLFYLPYISCRNHLKHSSIIEIDGGNFVQGRHSNPSALRKDYEKMNAAASLGWRVWHFMPEMVIKAGRKTKADEPVLTQLPW